MQAVGHGIFAMMNWGSFLFLALSVIVIILIAVSYFKEKKKWTKFQYVEQLEKFEFIELLENLNVNNIILWNSIWILIISPQETI